MNRRNVLKGIIATTVALLLPEGRHPSVEVEDTGIRDSLTLGQVNREVHRLGIPSAADGLTPLNQIPSEDFYIGRMPSSDIYHLDIPSADTAIYYVSEDGDDANNGLTPKTALRTYDQALSRCTAEDLIINLMPRERWMLYTARWRPDAPPVFQRDMEEISVVDFLTPLGHYWPDVVDRVVGIPEGTITYWFHPREKKVLT